MFLRKSIAKQTGFALRLANHVGAAAAIDGRNLVFSPLSLHSMLSLIAAGSKGPTRDEILPVLGSANLGELSSLASRIVSVVLSDASASGGPRIVFSNGVWVDRSVSLKPSFKQIASETYKAEAKTVDFQSNADQVAKEVNAWVENLTSGLIKGLLPSGSVDHETRLVFGNALYFKGLWDKKFDATGTTNSEFHLLDGSSVQVPFMTSEDKQLLSAHDGFKVLGLPYKKGVDGRQFSMYLFLPDAQDGLWSLLEKLKDLGSLDRYLPARKVAVGEFKIPKFKVSFGFEASEVLKALGLELLFSENCDLSEMVDSPTGQNLYVPSVIHKSFIEVNEEGTEAAAASVVVVLGSARVYQPPLDFVADHSFLFLIREDRTGVILFVGHVINPLLV
ncbi:serpin-ZXA-like [Dioscorea cayenensis subsp. rotundata]|uniref:Serpin-ZXA-like n=1 Tax=Dioscorea cayennensis subsp. rotundata TaxID=55577 RepID=A0AB40AQG0_DIOCR|nr:serpin-ZXA-like [Dioscorea cayenensis subsp. rotundata]